jgi:hypothetical protein
MKRDSKGRRLSKDITRVVMANSTFGYMWRARVWFGGSMGATPQTRLYYYATRKAAMKADADHAVGTNRRVA